MKKMLRPFHTGDHESEEDAGVLQRFIDSDGGELTANILHSVGALLFAGGIALYLYIAHSIRRSRGDVTGSHLGLLNYAHGFNLVGIALNGIGGVMRLKVTGHPGLDRLGDSTWVQAILVKHLFLAAGVGLGVYLTWRTFRLQRIRPDPERVYRESPRMVGYALASLATILIAAVLGSVAGNTDLNADLGIIPESMDPDGEPDGPGPAFPEPGVLNELSTSSKITGSAAMPDTADHQFQVPVGSDRVVAVLSWSTDVAQLSLSLFDANGSQATGENEVIGTSQTLTITGNKVTPGLWTLRVRADQAIEEEYSLRASAIRSLGEGNLLERTVTIQPGAFFEANLLMAQGRNLAYEWFVVAAPDPVYFDIHFHPSALDVQYAEQGDWNQRNGNYTHTSDAQGPSLLWENTQGTALDIHFAVSGDFSVHSFSA